jgi:F0F1-type ATP synthase delta subunit
MATVTHKQLVEIFGNSALHARNSKEFANAVASYVVSGQSKVQLHSLIRDIMKYRQANGIIEAVVCSAHPLNEQIRSDIEALVRTEFKAAKSVIISERLDPSVLGGVKIEFPGEQLDASLSARLQTLKRRIA